MEAPPRKKTKLTSSYVLVDRFSYRYGHSRDVVESSRLGNVKDDEVMLLSLSDSVVREEVQRGICVSGGFVPCGSSVLNPLRPVVVWDDSYIRFSQERCDQLKHKYKYVARSTHTPALDSIVNSETEADNSMPIKLHVVNGSEMMTFYVPYGFREFARQSKTTLRGLGEEYIPVSYAPDQTVYTWAALAWTVEGIQLPPAVLKCDPVLYPTSFRVVVILS